MSNVGLLAGSCLALATLLPMPVTAVQGDTPQVYSSPTVVSVENCGLLFTDNQAGVSGTDTGYSLPIGRQTIWFFGDVFLLQPTLPNKQYVANVSNCALVVPSGSGPELLRRYTFLTDPATGLARQVISGRHGGSKDPTVARRRLV